MREVIDAVQNTDEQMVLRYRYIHNMTWEQIGAELKADERHGQTVDTAGALQALSSRLIHRDINVPKIPGFAQQCPPCIYGTL